MLACTIIIVDSIDEWTCPGFRFIQQLFRPSIRWRSLTCGKSYRKDLTRSLEKSALVSSHLHSIHTPVNSYKSHNIIAMVTLAGEGALQ